MANPTIVRNAANSKMTVTDRIMLALISKGEQEVHFNLTDFATSIDMPRMSAYQGLYRLQNSGALEVLTERSGDGIKRTIGVRLHKVPTANDIIAKAMTRPADTARAVGRSVARINRNIPNVLSYVEKKSVLDSIRGQLFEAGYNPDEVLTLPVTDNLAEEACFLYNELCDAQRQIAQLEAQANLAQRLPAPEPVALPIGEPVLA